MSIFDMKMIVSAETILNLSLSISVTYWIYHNK